MSDADDVTVTKAQFQTVLRLARAEAWDEGYDAGEVCAMDAMSDDHACFLNPYRQETSDE
ncbi:hypothetical protein [Dietzia sp. ANT_WB102]|uniref:hypothetical protein n=1 Tax=Dietzia sp. ANT_WB102 TaxID=2597345 RepID=UPI0011EF77E1|nr:hypothetical protein [Dietzia sp. ANT_WB102]KAA0916445.1 hypothetical protein FQ137_14570 [Dietzia sp. ANT_WB102]